MICTLEYYINYLHVYYNQQESREVSSKILYISMIACISLGATRLEHSSLSYISHYLLCIRYRLPWVASCTFSAWGKSQSPL